jgi:hypothetical protein
MALVVRNDRHWLSENCLASAGTGRVNGLGEIPIAETEEVVAHSR